MRWDGTELKALIIAQKAQEPGPGQLVSWSLARSLAWPVYNILPMNQFFFFFYYTYINMIYIDGNEDNCMHFEKRFKRIFGFKQQYFFFSALDRFP